MLKIYIDYTIHIREMDLVEHAAQVLKQKTFITLQQHTMNRLYDLHAK